MKAFHDSRLPNHSNTYEIFNFFFDGAVEWHVKHQYYKEMSAKSKVVSKVFCIMITLFVYLKGTPWYFNEE